MLTGQTLRHGHTKRHGHAQRDCLVDVLVNNAMLKSFSKMIKTLRQVLNKTKYNKNFLKKLTANITFTVKKKKKDYLPSTYTVVPMLEKFSVYWSYSKNANAFTHTYVVRNGFRSLKTDFSSTHISGWDVWKPPGTREIFSEQDCPKHRRVPSNPGPSLPQI